MGVHVILVKGRVSGKFPPRYFATVITRLVMTSYKERSFSPIATYISDELLCHMGGCENYDQFLDTLNIRCRIIIGIPKRDHNFDNHPHLSQGNFAEPSWQTGPPDHQGPSS